MHKPSRIAWFVLCMVLCQTGCKQIYEPPAIKANNDYLVVDGFINIGPGAVTSINLNRTRRLTDTTATGIPELGAQVSILSNTGAAFALQDTAHKGIYVSQPLALDISRQYRIAVTTSDGRKYQSDLVSCKPSPSIDSITWEQPFNLTFFVSTHDVDAKTRFYRWDYIETWEHDAPLQTPWGVKDGMIFAVDSTTQKAQCWTTVQSTSVMVDNSTALSQDLVEKFPLYTIPYGDSRLDVKYSVLVRQFALTEDAYNYWVLIEKTSQGLGTLFDLQPTQLHGNIHCISNPSEPVIGFMSATSVQQERLFLYNTNLSNWPHNSPGFGCDTTEIPQNPVDFRIYNFADTFYAPYYFISNGPLVLASRVCLDCTLFGGNNVRPPYWP
ncbi:MAG: DUF4249 domain-containing protein [Bacteroidota bacterium]|nr:DUF4249 domain-containing protein [Bacteroidota bacterium]MDP4216670.1 DUF4249 domain-containing protein [Bacteroidota bacterium]MDP4244227.1 DUF4249 domain-containing protein [Bacteroidota bacterium]MDP4253401.1 DUF4249 domain-containing protein [Bacteroidota bacterium]MDP4258887.1 DUF4249 domain-containing protein [Bacteroidota bacterium]